MAHPSLRDQLISPVLAGNVTGLSLAPVALAGKTVELLREVLPRSTRFVGLAHGADPLHRDFLAEAESSTTQMVLGRGCSGLGAGAIHVAL